MAIISGYAAPVLQTGSSVERSCGDESEAQSISKSRRRRIRTRKAAILRSQYATRELNVFLGTSGFSSIGHACKESGDGELQYIRSFMQQLDTKIDMVMHLLCSLNSWRSLDTKPECYGIPAYVLQRQCDAAKVIQ